MSLFLPYIPKAKECVSATLEILKFSIYLFLSCLITSCNNNGNTEKNPENTPDTTIVDKHDLLQVDGNKIVNKGGEPVSLAGNSFFWSEDDLTDAGKLAKNIIVNWPGSTP